MPAEQVLGFLVLTGADPSWLLTGERERLTEETHLFPSEMAQSRTSCRTGRGSTTSWKSGNCCIFSESPLLVKKAVRGSSGRA